MFQAPPALIFRRCALPLTISAAAHSHLCAVHLVHVPSSWVMLKGGRQVGGNGKPSLPSPNFCVQTTNDRKKCCLHCFLGLIVELQAERDKGTAGWWSHGRCRAGVSIVSWEPRAHLPAANPPWWIDEAPTDSAHEELYLGLEHTRTWLKHTVIPQTITRIHLLKGWLLLPPLCFTITENDCTTDDESSNLLDQRQRLNFCRHDV